MGHRNRCGCWSHFPIYPGDPDFGPVAGRGGDVQGGLWELVLRQSPALGGAYSLAIVPHTLR